MVAFIGRTYAADGSTENELLSEFMEMALPPGAQEKSSDVSIEDEYLSLFIDSALEKNSSEYDSLKIANEAEKLDMEFSRFIPAHARANGAEWLIRITAVKIPTSGFAAQAPDSSLLCYVISGSGEVIFDGKGTPLRKYDCVWLDCSRRVKFRAYPDKPWECAFVRVQNGEKSNFELFCGVYSRLYSGRTLFLTFGAGSRFRSVVWQLLNPRTGRGPNSNLLYEYLLAALYNELAIALTANLTRQEIVPDVIVAIQNYLENNYHNKVSLDELSERFHISKFHMSRKFKQYLGTSPNDYLINLRLNKAKQLLSDSDFSVAEVGRLVGIPNANHFLYLFKNREGMTPSAFRKRRI